MTGTAVPVPWLIAVAVVLMVVAGALAAVEAALTRLTRGEAAALVAEAQAITAKHSTQDELIMLTTHGLLHLLGFDHAEPEEEREMFGIQRDILVGFAMDERRRRK